MDNESKSQSSYSDESVGESPGLAAGSANRVWTEEVVPLLIFRRTKY